MNKAIKNKNTAKIIFVNKDYVRGRANVIYSFFAKSADQTQSKNITGELK